MQYSHAAQFLYQPCMVIYIYEYSFYVNSISMNNTEYVCIVLLWLSLLQYSPSSEFLYQPCVVTFIHEYSYISEYVLLWLQYTRPAQLPYQSIQTQLL